MSRIIVIDNDEGVRELLGQTLTWAGHDVARASGGKEGLEILRRAPTDIVITELVMPIFDGLETIAEIRKSFPNVAVIAMSGASIAGAMLSVALQWGVDAVLQKPFGDRELQDAMRAALSKRTAHA